MKTRRRSIWLWLLAGALLTGFMLQRLDQGRELSMKPRKANQSQAISNDQGTAGPVDGTSASASSSRSVRDAAGPTRGQTMYVDASRLNVRAGPGLSYKQVWTLKQDEAVTVVGYEGEWRRVSGRRYDGWVYGGYLTPARQAPNKTKPQPRAAGNARLSDADIAKLLIRRSIALYRGACPCPYNRTKNGRSCGGNSAYSRPGGASPLCYAADVSAQMIAAYRDRQ